MAYSWWTGALICEKTPEGISALVIEAENFNPEYPRIIRTIFPGGVRRRNPREMKRIQTLRREIRQETGLVIREDARPWHLCTAISYTKRGNEFHQMFYLIDRADCDGELRVKEINDGWDRLSPPHPVELTELRDGDILFHTHRQALLLACEIYGLVG